MEKFLYIDCFSGISGDMMVAALLDLGLDLEIIRQELKKLPLKGYEIELRETRAKSLAAKKFEVKVIEQKSRNYRDIRSMLEQSRLKESIKKDSLDMFGILARAEARVHGCKEEQVHFHEVGAVDSIVDIVSVATAIDKLEITGVFSSNIPLGRGMADSGHGKIPVPAPAVLEILKGLPVYAGPFEFETTTPTGAAVIKKYVQDFIPLPEASIEAVGTGAGSRQHATIPNVLRLLKFSTPVEAKPSGLKLLSANIDDLSPEIMGYVAEKLLEQGALDVWIENILMKKGRPGFKLCALAAAARENQLTSLIFCQTTTLGVRSISVDRHTLDREVIQLNLSYGKALIKLGLYKGKTVTAEPEYESCLSLAQQTGRPLKQVYQEVKQAYHGKVK
ncbi:MAG: nickel pincer cofactor biosynthesis protein LarC [Actinomycetota bacterium]|nr:nickel pincer cofactor biosynthesis protein LarC [Actinomycetota bacterium]